MLIQFISLRPTSSVPKMIGSNLGRSLSGWHLLHHGRDFLLVPLVQSQKPKPLQSPISCVYCTKDKSYRALFFIFEEGRTQFQGPTKLEARLRYPPLPPARGGRRGGGGGRSVDVSAHRKVDKDEDVELNEDGEAEEDGVHEQASQAQSPV